MKRILGEVPTSVTGEYTKAFTERLIENINRNIRLIEGDYTITKSALLSVDKIYSNRFQAIYDLERIEADFRDFVKDPLDDSCAALLKDARDYNKQTYHNIAVIKCDWHESWHKEFLKYADFQRTKSMDVDYLDDFIGVVRKKEKEVYNMEWHKLKQWRDEIEETRLRNIRELEADKKAFKEKSKKELAEFIKSAAENIKVKQSELEEREAQSFRRCRDEENRVKKSIANMKRKMSDEEKEFRQRLKKEREEEFSRIYDELLERNDDIINKIAKERANKKLAEFGITT